MKKRNAEIQSLIDNGATVVVTVPLAVALRVVDNELGDSHTLAVLSLENAVIQIVEAEYGIDEKWAGDYHLAKGCYGPRGGQS